jgi:hypothetical protein
MKSLKSTLAVGSLVAILGFSAPFCSGIRPNSSSSYSLENSLSRNRVVFDLNGNGRNDSYFDMDGSKIAGRFDMDGDDKPDMMFVFDEILSGYVLKERTAGLLRFFYDGSGKPLRVEKDTKEYGVITYDLAAMSVFYERGKPTKEVLYDNFDSMRDFSDLAPKFAEVLKCEHHR